MLNESVLTEWDTIQLMLESPPYLVFLQKVRSMTEEGNHE